MKTLGFTNDENVIKENLKWKIKPTTYYYKDNLWK